MHPHRLTCFGRVCFLGLLLLGTTVVRGEDAASSAARMLNDVKTLASDEFEGRGIGTDGLDKALDYVAEQFRIAGLKVDVAGGDPFQEFEVLDGAKLGEPNSLLLTGPDGRQLQLKLGDDFQVCSFGDTGSFTGKLVFAGYGIEAADLEYSDYGGIDVAGAVVIIMRRNPLQGNPHGPFAVGHGISRHAALNTKVSQAYSKGAAAVLLVNDPYTGRNEAEKLREQLQRAQERVIAAAEQLVTPGDAGGESDPLQQLQDAVNHLKQVRELIENHRPDELMEFGYAGTRTGKSLPVFHITQKVCDQMLQQSLGMTLADIEARIDETGQPASRALTGWAAQGVATLSVIRRPTKNVVAVLEGAGPLQEETIVIGAHVDHLGYGGEGSLAPKSHEIHNGADDNASGTAGLLELARRLAARNDTLPRRIVFIGFSGEERGLLGSAEYVKQPLIPLDDTIAMFNMDMIGRMEDNKLTVFGSGTSSRWDALLDATAASHGLTLAKKPEGFGPSDHSSFYAKQIPVLHLFTGIHSDYHRPSDDWDRINAEGMERAVSFLEQLVIATAQNPQRPDYLHVAGKAELDRSGRRPYFGSIPDFSSDAPGYAIQGVAPGSPADKAGLKGGDVIIRLGDSRIGGLDDFDLALRKFSPGEQVEVVVLRNGEEVTLNVTLASPRG